MVGKRVGKSTSGQIDVSHKGIVGISLWVCALLSHVLMRDYSDHVIKIRIELIEREYPLAKIHQEFSLDCSRDEFLVEWALIRKLLPGWKDQDG